MSVVPNTAVGNHCLELHRSPANVNDPWDCEGEEEPRAIQHAALPGAYH